MYLIYSSFKFSAVWSVSKSELTSDSLKFFRQLVNTSRGMYLHGTSEHRKAGFVKSIAVFDLATVMIGSFKIFVPEIETADRYTDWSSFQAILQHTSHLGKLKVISLWHENIIALTWNKKIHYIFNAVLIWTTCSVVFRY